MYARGPTRTREPPEEFRMTDVVIVAAQRTAIGKAMALPLSTAVAATSLLPYVVGAAMMGHSPLWKAGFGADSREAGAGGPTAP